MTPGDMGARLTGFSRSGSVLQSARDSLRRLEHLFIQPKTTGIAFGSSLSPTTRKTVWARHPAYPRPIWGTTLQFSTPKGYGLRCPARLVRPHAQPYPFRSGNARDKDVKNHGDLDREGSSRLARTPGTYPAIMVGKILHGRVLLPRTESHGRQPDREKEEARNVERLTWREDAIGLLHLQTFEWNGCRRQSPALIRNGRCDCTGW